MAVFIRFFLGVPMFAILCVISAAFAFAVVRPETMAQRLLWTTLAAFFAAQAYAIWSILLARRAEPAHHRSPGGGSSGPRRPDAGKPAPLNPSPSHHLAAAKELPPSEATRTFPHD